MIETGLLRRRFAEIDGRRIHYLRMGVGPPVVLVHSSPTNAWYVAPHMRLLAERFTCYAFDTPGFGLSDALPGETLEVGDLADALAENMVVADLPACPVFGTHSGAAIALSLAARNPERVTALVLDGVPIFTPDEQAAIFIDYFQPMVPDDRGGHFANTWTRFRDQYIWFPWTSRTPDRHNDTDLAPAPSIHAWIESFFYAGATYQPAYRACCFYGDEAISDSRAVRCPVVYTATDTDMLYPHLERLAPLPPLQEIRRIGADRTKKDTLIAEVFDRWSSAPPVPMESFSLSSGSGVRNQFVDVGRGQVLLRHAGDFERPAILVLHDAPGSGLSLCGPDGLLVSLAESFLVLVPDLPGSGGSDPIAQASGTMTSSGAGDLDAWADTMAAVCATAGVTRVCAYGIGIGASVAVRLATRHPSLVGEVVIRGLALPDAEQRDELRRRYAPPITIAPDGSHWYRTWLMLRDQQIFFPWYDSRAVRQRRVSADFGAAHLHAWTFEVMKQHAHYHELIDAALAYDCLPDLERLVARLAVCRDPHVPFHAYADALTAARPDAVDLPTAPAAQRVALTRFVGD